MPPKATFPSSSTPRSVSTRPTCAPLTSRGGGGGAPSSAAPSSRSHRSVTTTTKTMATRDGGTVDSNCARAYGDIVESDEVHGEIKELGTQVKSMIAQHLPRHGTSEEQVMWGVRQFGPSKESRRVLNKENDAARLAWETGVYCLWRCLEKPRLGGANQDFCCRIGYQHVCFCGHTLAAHTTPGRAANSSATQANRGSGNDRIAQSGDSGNAPSRGSPLAPATDAQLAQWKGPCEEVGCSCGRYRYVPNTPLEIGEGWLTRRANWKASEWSAKCRCGHGHKAHDPKTMRCQSCGGCPGFTSAFLCVVCDLPWEAHDTVWESEGVRVAEGHPVCEGYAPLSGIDWDVREAVLTDVTMSGRIEPPATHLALQQRSSKTAANAASSAPRGIASRQPSSTAATADREGGPSLRALPAIASRVADPILDAEYCRYCATVYKSAESKFCTQCGQPRPQRPATLR
ncbi:hypothetical protein LSCM1_06679 [Leishmania martiniquensis]|uniref:Uncharacterized protein n=1 Tax=Leishmania martiniquensis TaxID=1580590 RepID=A0A836GVR0_9TRYP|nr:hypothetical protein LSCM1_06679 [Leishmania martiniquensis]